MNPMPDPPMAQGRLQGRRVLVTGATGFIGGHLARRLAQVEGARVVGTGRTEAQARTLRELGIELVAADLKQPDSFGEALADVDVVFHVAAWLPRSGGRPGEAERLNVDGTRALFELAGRCGVRRFVHVSTVSAYGLPQRDRVDEDHPLDPDSGEPYGRSKARGELALASAEGPELVVVRPGMVYGPGSTGWTVGMVDLLERGLPVVFGDGAGTAFPIYIDNLVDLLIRASVAPVAGQRFNATDSSPTWRQWFEYYAAMTGRPARRLPHWAAFVVALANKAFALGLPVDFERLRMLRRPISFPSDAAQRELDWSPRIPLDEGMARSHAWLRSSGRLG